MQTYLLCTNPACRFVLDLQELARPVQLPLGFLDECPECGSQWSSTCPFCVQPLSIGWHGHVAHCARCHRKFHAQAADRKSTRLNSSHRCISYAVFCLKKKKYTDIP